jgi:hypothetical protein
MGVFFDEITKNEPKNKQNQRLLTNDAVYQQ